MHNWAHFDLAIFKAEDFDSKDAGLDWLCTLLSFTEELLEVVIDGNELMEAVDGTSSVFTFDDLAGSGKCLC